MMSDYKVGTQIKSWKDGAAQTLTFVVTEDCNLRCKYCYITHKRSNKVMTFDVAKKAIDYILENNINKMDALIIEFIGGEPLLQIDLIDQISDYFKIKAFEMHDKWFWNYRFSICTNGVNYSDEKIQRYIKKNMGKLSLSISIDGIKEKHDLNRVFPNGKGSYDIIDKSIPLWLNQFYPSTKVTFASDDLKYLKDSIIQLYNKGITDIASNVVFENVWQEGDDIIFERQLTELADYIIDNNLYNKFRCSFFDDSIGGYQSEEEKNQTYCGAGKMLAIGPEGKLYPCIRYKDYSLNHKEEWIIGTLDSGIDMEKVRPFMVVTSKLQSDNECMNCEIASGCAVCQGFNYDEAEIATNFSRAKYICKMHKARVRANDYYFSKLFNKKNIQKEMRNNPKKQMSFLLDSDFTDYCLVSKKARKSKKMDASLIKQGLVFCRNNFYDPIFIHSSNIFDFQYLDEYEIFNIKHIIPWEFRENVKDSRVKNILWVFNEQSYKISSKSPTIHLDNCIFVINSKRIDKLSEYVNSILRFTDRININIQDMTNKFNFDEYRNQLIEIKNQLLKFIADDNIIKEVNILTDVFNLKDHNNCKAGNRNFTLAPDGEIYICPYSFSNDNASIGDLSNGLNKLYSKHLYDIDNHPICNLCKGNQCADCVYLNQLYTNEISVSPSFQCKKTMIENEISYQLQRESMVKLGEFNLDKIEYLDPIERWLEENITVKGYYKCN